MCCKYFFFFFTFLFTINYGRHSDECGFLTVPSLFFWHPSLILIISLFSGKTTTLLLGATEHFLTESIFNDGVKINEWV